MEPPDQYRLADLTKEQLLQMYLQLHGTLTGFMTDTQKCQAQVKEAHENERIINRKRVDQLAYMLDEANKELVDLKAAPVSREQEVTCTVRVRFDRGGRIIYAVSEPPGYRTAKEIFEECLRSVNDGKPEQSL